MVKAIKKTEAISANIFQLVHLYFTSFNQWIYQTVDIKAAYLQSDQIKLISNIPPEFLSMETCEN